MTSPDISHAPGCFGSALTFSAAASECKSCMFAEACGPLSHQRLVSLRARLGKTAPRIPSTAVTAKPVKDPTALAIPKKVQALLDRIERDGIKVNEGLLKGENPFPTTPSFMRVACQILLQSRDGASREAFERVFMSKLNWTHGTAVAHALQASQALQALGAAEEINGRLKLKGK